MKNLRILFILISFVIASSCDKNDDGSNAPIEGTTFQATVNGGNYSNYTFDIGVYAITKGTNGNTLSIDIGDVNGEQLTLFLNGTDGFSNGTIKQMGNEDTNNFVTYALFRQQNPLTSYYSTNGNVTITNNRTHPTESSKGLISGNFDITVSPIDSNIILTLTGSFTELEYLN
jgi:hypothetical protein